LGVSFEIEGFQVAKALLGDTTVTMAMSQNPDLILLNVGYREWIVLGRMQRLAQKRI